jgi:cytochrome c
MSRAVLSASPLLAAVLACLAAAPACAADVEAGKAIFERTCHTCHSLDVGMNKVGPTLWHVVGRPTAVIDGYMYSDAMKNLHGTWTKQALDIYLTNPRGTVHGVKMYFKGLPDPEDRANVIAFLAAQE